LLLHLLFTLRYLFDLALPFSVVLSPSMGFQPIGIRAKYRSQRVQVTLARAISLCP
jgi:hypothetical protein